ncbi:exodeoxyribonuclease VII small subunit [Desulfovibrio gilichinskyi]|uniref:Exodeoxyribonuclease 7 small subunit n=1 Tax=Desulfovibrio gilichinskyi TaxID=1519643 RepID=A0A1X7CRE5_9BACT|nr:exodeoxyribonuclease VII small subunit [Desulfovibrio gilichinskyi]SMF01607.1 Exodeoxyribonuclease VII small subunit [Desulfovibrio gilichinskyi]
MKDNKNFEERLERLKAIVAGLEQGDLPLEEGVALFKEGQSLAKKCADQLQKAANEVKIVGDGLIKDFEAKVENEDMTDDN